MTTTHEYTVADVLAMVAREIRRAGSLRLYAKELRVSPAYLSDVMRGRRGIGPKILAPHHLETVPPPRLAPTYRKVTDHA